MVDFKKLNDPVWIAEARAAREAEEREAEIGRALVRNALDRCERAADWIEPKERAFVESCRRQFYSNFEFLSQKQLVWLGDIEHRVDGRLGFIAVTSGMRGFFAVHMRTSDESEGDFWPQQTGSGSYRTAEQAGIEAKEWAEAEGIRYEGPAENAGSPVLLKQWLDKRAAAKVTSSVPALQSTAPQTDSRHPTPPNAGVRAIQAARAKALSKPGHPAALDEPGVNAAGRVAPAIGDPAGPGAVASGETVQADAASSQPDNAAAAPARHFRRKFGS